MASRALAPGVFELALEGDASGVSRPGQFVEIAVPGHFLRRPISICDWSDNSLTLLIRKVGHGTAWLEGAEAGETLDLLLPLGNGFDAGAAPAGAGVMLVGGGIGIAPLFALAKSIVSAGRPCTAVLGFRSAGDLFYADRFAEVGCETIVATEDGSAGTRGLVTDAICGHAGHGAGPGPYLFACGPMPMMRALARLRGVSGGQFSLEARMGCGFGACMGCTIETASGPARICADGPVFSIAELQPFLKSN